MSIEVWLYADDSLPPSVFQSAKIKSPSLHRPQFRELMAHLVTQLYKLEKQTVTVKISVEYTKCQDVVWGGG